MSKVVLREGREKSLQQRHPWIFSGAIHHLPEIQPGEILSVYGFSGQFLAKAYFHPKNSIAGRVLTFQDEPIEDAVKKHIQLAIAYRRSLFNDGQTNAYRLINSEGDNLPGLVVDCYADVLVIQISTYGMERLKNLIVEMLIAEFSPKTIYEKSVSFARKQEGLDDRAELIFGEDISEVEVLENNMKFLVSVKDGQKTGLFLDQRERRLEIEKFSANKRVLNCFSYTGGFSLFALRGGATHVESVDSCSKACKQAKKNAELNKFDNHTVHCQDAFSFLKHDPLNFDLIILDPPAFAKKRADIVSACHGYKAINRFVFEKAKPGTLLLTCSCSSYIDEKLFQMLLFQTAQETKREVKIISRHLLAHDHPISLFHPEGEYLKSFLLYLS